MKQISQQNLLTAAIELAQGVTASNRFDALLSTVRKMINCDAVVVLSYQSGTLTPLAQQGLMSEVLGRRFDLADNPRLEQICKSKQVVRFDSDSDLPDPYDGLLIGCKGDLPIHACMGFPLYFEDSLIGVLTLDSLSSDAFETIDSQTLDMISSMASVSLNTSLTIAKLETNIVSSNHLVNELSHYRGHLDETELIGRSSVMMELKRNIKLVAASEYSVLIQGESGTGKELVADLLHQSSHRAQLPMIYLNCAALPENLLESELFGHVKGAYTGAERSRLGKFRLADNGTLFLDEIGELPLAAQGKLLRALQENEIQSVGQDKVEKVNVRVIAATNRDLAKEVEAGRFREDLFHRLNVFPISVPPLSQRAGDLPLLIGFFTEKLKRQLGVQQIKTSAELQSKLNEYDWPGNVRELEHLLTRTALKALSREKDRRMVKLEVDDCGELKSRAAVADEAQEQSIVEVVSDAPLKQQVDEFQRNLVKNVLLQHQGNWTAAAKQLGVDRANLTRLAKRLGVTVSKVITS